jgi:hypothetical protein
VFARLEGLRLTLLELAVVPLVVAAPAGVVLLEEVLSVSSVGEVALSEGARAVASVAPGEEGDTGVWGSWIVMAILRCVGCDKGNKCRKECVGWWLRDCSADAVCCVVLCWAGLVDGVAEEGSRAGLKR